MSTLHTGAYKDWQGDEWAGEQPHQARSGAPHWNKYEWVGDHGDGTPESKDPEQMPEGETSISGMRHNPSGNHWVPQRPH